MSAKEQRAMRIAEKQTEIEKEKAARNVTILV
jgi:hypothetical protein